jgi:hypothetical protein
MRQASKRVPDSAEKTVRDIRMKAESISSVGIISGLLNSVSRSQASSLSFASPRNTRLIGEFGCLVILQVRFTHMLLQGDFRIATRF